MVNEEYAHILVQSDAANFLEGNVFWEPFLSEIEDIV